MPTPRDKARATIQGRNYTEPANIRSQIPGFLKGAAVSGGKAVLSSLGKEKKGSVAGLLVGKDFLKGETGGLLGIVEEFVQSPLRVATRAGLTGIEKFTGKEQDIDLGPVASKIYGVDKIESFGVLSKDIREDYLKPLGADEKELKYAPGGVIAVGAILDFATGGKSKPLFSKLVKETVESRIAKQLTKAGLKDLAENPTLLREIAEANTEKGVQRAIGRATGRLVEDVQTVKNVAAKREAGVTARKTTDGIVVKPSTRTQKAAVVSKAKATVQGKTAGTTPAAAKTTTFEKPQNVRERAQATVEQRPSTAKELELNQKLIQEDGTVARSPLELTDRGYRQTVDILEQASTGKKLTPDLEDNLRYTAGELGIEAGARPIKEVADEVADLLQGFRRQIEKRISDAETIQIQDLSKPPRSRSLKNRKGGFAKLPLGDAEGAQVPKTTPAAKSVSKKVSKDDIFEAKGADRTGSGRSQDSVHIAADQVDPKTQQPSLLAQRQLLKPQRSFGLSSLSKDSTKTARSARKEYDKYTKAVEKALSDKKFGFTNIREKVQDQFIRVRKLQQGVAKGEPIPDDINIDQAETLFHGRVHTKLEEIKDRVTVMDKDMTKAAKAAGVSPDDFAADVNSYLHARHAAERNKQLKIKDASGLTNEEAQAILKEIDDLGYSKDIKAHAAKLKELNDETLDILLDGEIIDQATYDTLKKTYKNHVPLQRIQDKKGSIQNTLAGKGLDVKGTGLKRARGSKKQVADVTGNIMANVEQAIIRSEKNLVDLTTYRWYKENKDLGLMKQVKPKGIGKTFDDEGVILQDFFQDPTILSFRVKGKPTYLKIDNPQLATALKGVNVEQVHSLLRPIAYMTRLYSGLHTRFNYEFALSNNIRDIQEMAVDVASREGMGFGAAGKAVTKDVSSKKAVMDVIFDRDTEGARLYKQMKEDGGTTGGLGLSTRERVQVDLDKIRRLNRSKPRQAAKLLVKSIDNWNTIFEDATRLSVYRTALERGLTRKQAAVLAKESTINFNKKGTAGPLINGIYMFSNASIQGTTKILRAMKNPKVAAATVGSIGTAVYAANNWNDNVDPEWREKVSEWDRSSNLVIMLPTQDEGVEYITIPISWGLKPIKVSMEYMNDLIGGHAEIGEAAKGIALSTIEAYHPLAGDEDIVDTLQPSVIKPFVQISRNRAWHGNQIRPNWDVDAPDYTQYFNSLEDTLIGRLSIQTTQALARAGVMDVSPANMEYAITQYIGGAGKSLTRILDTVDTIASDEDLKAKETPFINRFYKEKTEEEVFTNLFYSTREKEDKEKAAKSAEDKLRVKPIYEEVQMLMRAGEVEKARRITRAMSKEDYAIYEKFKAADKRRAGVAAQIKIYPLVREVEELMRQGKTDEAKAITRALSKDEYAAYKKAKEALGITF